jgi:hypothetical protein
MLPDAVPEEVAPMLVVALCPETKPRAPPFIEMFPEVEITLTASRNTPHCVLPPTPDIAILPDPVEIADEPIA